MNGLRVAIGSIFTECNEFGGVPIDLDCFERYDLRRGGDLLSIGSGVVGGMLQTLRDGAIEPVPLLYASTCPGGPIRAGCYARLKAELLALLRDAMPVQGVLLPLHGAAVAEDVGDVEGDLIRGVREMVGPAVPVAATLDLHAHVTPDMVRLADALVAWETYPHRDAFSTGERGARLLIDALEGRCRPAMVMAKVPVLTSALRGSTEWDDPFARIMRFAKSHEGRGSVVSTSVFLVHCPLDQPDLGSGGLVITNDDMDGARALARRIAEEYWALRFDLEPEVHAPADAISRGLKVDGGPVILVEAADCGGGGAAGDSVATLRALLAESPDQPSLVPVVDPEAAAACHQAGAGREATVSLGHKLDPRWGRPIEVTGRVARLSRGRFRYAGGIWGGVEGDMGPTAVLEIRGIRALITSHSTYDWADEQFRSVGLDPSAAKFIVAKNPMNYRMAYGAVARAVFVLDTPGPTPATLSHLRYEKLKRPYFPVDREIPGLTPTILQ